MNLKPIKTFKQTAIASIDDFVYGTAPNPVKTRSGMIIGGGTVYPEVNMTLPPMKIEPATISEVYKQYKEMIEGILKRARDLHVPGIIIEVELLPETTWEPIWGIEINRILLEHMRDFEAKYGLKSALRCTPNDIREMVRPSYMRQGQLLENMFTTFQRCAEEGADILSIESTGGKELHDEALINCDIRKAVFALGVLGVRDMRFLWSHIVQIAQANGSIPGGDTACGFANTAMVLAEQGMIPKVFAAVDRVASVPRTLAAYEMGAVGPNKDCSYEGPYIKAIAGVPISMEGKTAACAHLSALGNIAACVCDCWSNESVQNIKLLSAPAPVVYTEQLIYDCRLMNQASIEGHEYAIKMRDWLAKSDYKFDPQAYVLKPDIVLEISKELVKEKDAFTATKKAAILAVDVIKRGIDKGEVIIAPREQRWLDIISAQLETIPDDEEEFWHQMKGEVDLTKWRAEEYGLN